MRAPRKMKQLVNIFTAKDNSRPRRLRGTKSAKHVSRQTRRLGIEPLENRELLSTVPGFYLAGVVGSNSQLYVVDGAGPSGEIWAFPVAELVTADGQTAPPPRDVGLFPGYAYTGYWDKQFLDVADNPENPLGMPSILRSWNLSSIAPPQEGEGEGEADRILQIPVVAIGNVYMNNPAYPGSGEPKYLDVRLNALEWSPELADGSRLLVGAGYAGVASQNSIRGHYLFIVNQHYGKARPIVDLGTLGVESAGDITFDANGTLYLSLKGGKLLVVHQWESPSPRATVVSLQGSAADFDALLPGPGNYLIGIAQNSDYYQIDTTTFQCEKLGSLPLHGEIWIDESSGGIPPEMPSPESPLIYGAFFGVRRPDDLGTIQNTLTRNGIRPYLFQRWYQFDVAQDGNLEITIGPQPEEDWQLGIELYVQVNGGPLLNLLEAWREDTDSVQAVYTRARADRPGQDFTYYIHIADFVSPINLRMQLTPGGPWPEVRLGVLGDMLSQEYAEHWFIEAKGWYDLLAETGRIDGGHYAPSYSDIRWQGYEYNWANWWATSESVLTSGQLEGILAQAQAGLLTHVVVALGPTDYASGEVYQQIYEGRWTPQQIAEFDSRRLAALQEILTHLTQTGVHVLLSTAIDPGFAPGIQAAYGDPAGRARVSQAVEAFNSKLRLLASDLGVPVIDSNGLMQAIFGPPAAPESVIWVGGVPLTHGQGNDPTWTFTANGICPGTVISGLWAGLIVQALNDLYGAGLPQLSVPEILERAGLADRYNPAGPSIALNYEQWIELPQLSPARNSLGGQAWLDRDRNGLRDPSESSVSGVEVTLMWAGWDERIGTEDDQLISQAVTAPDGTYFFEALRDGVYYLEVTPPSGHHFTYYLAGGDPGRDSDVVPLVGVSRPIRLEGGIVIDTVDIGLANSSILSPQNLGEVDYHEFNHRVPRQGQMYYRVQSTRAGIFSVGLDTPSQDAVLIVTDASGNPLGYSVGSGQVDIWARSRREVFYVYAGGISSASTLAIGNLVEYQSASNHLTIYSSTQRDRVRISVEPALSVQINGLSYDNIPFGEVSRLVFKGSQDLVELRTSSWSDRVNLTPGRLTGEVGPDGNKLTIQLDNWDGKFEVDMGLGIDILRIGGAAASSAETFEFGPGGIRWRNGTFDHRIWGAEDILIAAGNGANDSAFLTDPRGGTTVEAGPTNPNASRHLVALSGLTAEGYPYRCAVRGFHRVIVDVGGSTDFAYLYDSADVEDRFFIDPSSASLIPQGGGLIKVIGAEVIRAYGSTGNVSDGVTLTGSAGNDRFEAEGNLSRIVWFQDPNRTAELYGFGRVSVRGQEGSDEARLAIPSAELPVRFVGIAEEDYARLESELFRYELTGFEQVLVGPTDEVAQQTNVLGLATATLVDSSGNDDVYLAVEHGVPRVVLDTDVSDREGLPVGPQSPVQIGLSHFAEVTVESRSGGIDHAYFLSSSEEQERFVGTPDYAAYSGPGYQWRVFGFDRIALVADEDPTPPSVQLYGSPEDDTLYYGPLTWNDIEIGPGVLFTLGGANPTNFYLLNVNSVRVFADGMTGGGNDVAELYGLAGRQERFAALAATRTVVYSATDSPEGPFQLTAIGFQHVRMVGNASAGDLDTALIIDSLGNDILRADGSINPRQISLEALDHVLTLEDLAEITAVRFFGGDDVVDIQHPEELEFDLELVGGWD